MTLDSDAAAYVWKAGVGEHNGKVYPTKANANLRVVKNDSTLEIIGEIGFYEHRNEAGDVDDCILTFKGKYNPANFDATGVLRFPKDGQWGVEHKKYRSSIEARAVRFVFCNPVDGWTSAQITIRHDDRNDARLSKAYYGALEAAQERAKKRFERESLEDFKRIVDESDDEIVIDNLDIATGTSPTVDGANADTPFVETPQDALHVANTLFLFMVKGTVWSGSGALALAYLVYLDATVSLVSRAVAVKGFFGKWTRR